MRTVVLLFLLAGITGPALAAAEACAPSCTVQGLYLGYASPVTILTSGSSVTWVFLDPLAAAHTATSSTGGSACMNMAFNAAHAVTGQFVIQDEGLHALTPSVTGTRDALCTEASPLPDGTYVLPYFCLYHTHMRGVLVVK